MHLILNLCSDVWPEEPNTAIFNDEEKVHVKQGTEVLILENCDPHFFVPNTVKKIKFWHTETFPEVPDSVEVSFYGQCANVPPISNKKKVELQLLPDEPLPLLSNVDCLEISQWDGDFTQPIINLMLTCSKVSFRHIIMGDFKLLTREVLEAIPELHFENSALVSNILRPRAPGLQ